MAYHQKWKFRSGLLQGFPTSAHLCRLFFQSHQCHLCRLWCERAIIRAGLIVMLHANVLQSLTRGCQMQRIGRNQCVRLASAHLCCLWFLCHRLFLCRLCLPYCQFFPTYL